MRIKTLTSCMFFALFAHQVWADEDVQFNADVLDVTERGNVDLSQFSRAGYVMPGKYTLTVHMNKINLPDESIIFQATDNDPKSSVACISPALVDKLGIKDEVRKKLTWWHQGQCLNIDSDILKGMTVHGDLQTSSLYVSIPQAYLDYTSDNWDPPSRWDDGIAGLMLDYYANAQKTHGSGDNASGYSTSGNGTVGANLGAWRLRADWQASRSRNAGNTSQQWQWSRYYLFRAIRSLRAKLILGEDYLDSDLFDSPRFAGIRLISDDNQLPPNLRGYAPEVTGVARTNAKVVVSQQGRVLYETQVAPGPFRIQTLNDATSGTLDVTVKEQDGSEQKFQVNTASVPYLTRPGMVRYKVAAGRPDDLRHRTNGPLFGTGEFSWGINNGWSLYGGGLFGSDYNALSMGIGRDLLVLGAMSFDVTSSRTQLPRQDTLSGNSYRLSYSKTFNSLDSQVTFAGYRFSQRTYLSLNDYLDARDNGWHGNGNKAVYTLSLNKQFRQIGLSANFNISRQTYWNNAPASLRYSFMMAKYFDLWKWKNLSFSLSLFRNQYRDTWDKGGYLSLSIPIGNNDTLSYTGNVNNGLAEHRIGYYGQLDDRDSYQVNAGGGNSGIVGSGSFTHEGDMAELTASTDYQANRYTSVGVSARGGMTATMHGAALHRVNQPGGTRLMIGTDGVAGVPLHGYGSIENTNWAGVAVINDVNSYYRNTAMIDMDHLSDDVDVSAGNSVTEATLTDGAIGYRHFDVLAGKKAMAVIRLSSGESVPFGAEVKNGKGLQTGMVADDGETWLSGMNPSEVMQVQWSGKTQCLITLPQKLDAPSLLLPCLTPPETPEGKSHHD